MQIDSWIEIVIDDNVAAAATTATAAAVAVTDVDKTSKLHVSQLTLKVLKLSL